LAIAMVSGDVLASRLNATLDDVIGDGETT